MALGLKKRIDKAENYIRISDYLIFIKAFIGFAIDKRTVFEGLIILYNSFRRALHKGHATRPVSSDIGQRPVSEGVVGCVVL